jgi:hypothetical protein
MGLEFPKLEKIVAQCSDPRFAVFVSMWDRIGVKGWMTNLEYVYFRPDTPKNDEFNITIMKWPTTEMMFWAIIRIPREHEKLAKDLLWRHGLKVCGERDPEGGPYVPIVIIGGPEPEGGIHKFPFHGEHVFFLENHSKGAPNVAYTNDPEKIGLAQEHEEQMIAQYHKEHEEWLAVPENYAAAEAFWESRPDIYPPEKKPPRRF